MLKKFSLKKISSVNYPIKAIIINASDSKAGDDWAKSIAEMHPNVSVEQSYFGPVIGTHLGEKALALGWMIDTDKL